MNKQKIIFISAILVIVAAFGIGFKVYQKDKVEKMSFLAAENAELFVRDYSPRMGAEEAKVYLVEFLDPECESCRAFYPYVKMLMNEFPGQIKLVIRYMPFHGNSRFAIKILEAARLQGKYWEVMEKLFYYQPMWGSHHNPRPELIWKFLPEAGVDIAKIKNDMNNPEFERRIEQDFKDGRQLGVRATPSFYVNGKPLESFGYPQLRELVVSELNK